MLTDSVYAELEALPERPLGREFFYSSGTSGRPKGIPRPIRPYDRRREIPPLEARLRSIYGFDADGVCLCAAGGCSSANARYGESIHRVLPGATGDADVPTRPALRGVDAEDRDRQASSARDTRQVTSAIVAARLAMDQACLHNTRGCGYVGVNCWRPGLGV